MAIDRRDFLRAATAGAGLALGAGRVDAAGTRRTPAPSTLVRSGQAPDVVVVGAGNFGCWTALYLQRLGARVTLLDQYGPGNSRSASGGETRGVRTSYGDRPHGLQWGRWAAKAIERWKAWDEEHSDDALSRLFYTTGDIILREEATPYIEETSANWDAMGHPYEVLTPDEVRYRWPVLHTPDIDVALYEPAAGVVRARRAIESVARVFELEGGTIRIGRAEPGALSGRTLTDVRLADGNRISAGVFVFALGPWFPKVFPQLMARRVSNRTLGRVFYFATPPGDEAYRVPNLPSYNVPETTGWPALPYDSRGFRVRAGGHQGDDPDTSLRSVPEDGYARPREILRKYFPALAELGVNETRACHYASSVNRNFIIDRQPERDNVWFAGAGQAESFKQGPVLGEYVASRILERGTDPDLTRAFRFPEEEYDEEELERRSGEPGSEALFPPFGRRG